MFLEPRDDISSLSSTLIVLGGLISLGEVFQGGVSSNSKLGGELLVDGGIDLSDLNVGISEFLGSLGIFRG